MCTLFFALNSHPKYKFILIGNRDEFLNRPTEVAHIWKDKPNIFAGKDLQAGGTWLALGKNGRFATLTNYRDPHNIRKDAPSRGDLVVDFVENTEKPTTYLQSLQTDAHLYNGYNLLVYDKEELGYFSNIENKVKDLKTGIYAVSNAILDTPWPKVKKNKQIFAEILASTKDFSVEDCFTMLLNTETFPENSLPKTGVPLEWEKRLSVLFVIMPNYCTRVSTVVLQDYEGNGYMQERSYKAENEKIIEWNRTEIQF